MTAIAIGFFGLTLPTAAADVAAAAAANNNWPGAEERRVIVYVCCSTKNCFLYFSYKHDKEMRI